MPLLSERSGGGMKEQVAVTVARLAEQVRALSARTE